MTHRVTLVRGDCPDVADAVLALLARTGVELALEEPGATDVDAIAGSARKTGVGLIGWQRGDRDAGIAPPAVSLRKALNVHAQERPVRDLPGVPSRFEGVDLVVVRETTEDVYAMLEHETIPEVYESLKVTTESACRRIAHHAFTLARQQGRKKVTIVHKANIMKLSDGMFLRVGREVGAEFPDIETEDVIVDALCMRVVLDPTRFDVLLCGNLFGDIVGDLCAGLVGGPSNAPSINRADGTTLFMAGHGDPAELAGTGRANPLPLLLPAIHLLHHLGEDAAASALRTALEQTLDAGIRPVALGGDAGPEAFCAAVGERLA